MLVICLFFPAIIFTAIRQYVRKEKIKCSAESIFGLLTEYVVGNLIINGLIILGRLIISKEDSSSIYVAFSQYNDFAIKYLVLSVCLAIVLPFAEKLFKEKITFRYNISINKAKISEKVKFYVVLLVALVFALHYVVRMFDNSVWGDEGIVVGLVRKDWAGMLNGVAVNGHSPFHYAFAWLCVKLFGESGFIFHLSASLPYFILLILSVSFARKWFGNKASLVLISFCSLLQCAIIYNMEIRMYAWCQLFVFLSYLMLYKIYKTQGNIYYVLMAIFSLGAVYSHYFALASAGLLYLVLLVYSIVEKKKNIWKVVVSGGTVLALLVPWLLYAKKTRGVIISNYNIELVSWNDCVEFIFQSKYSMALLFIFFVLVFLWFCYDYGILSFSKNEDKNIVKLDIFPRIKLNAGMA